MSLREEILAKADSAREAVEVPEWGQTLYVRALSARARDAWDADNTERSKSGDAKLMVNFRARLVALAVVDEQGQPVFTLEDAEVLGEKSAKAIGRLFAAAVKLNGMSQAGLAEAEKK